MFAEDKVPDKSFNQLKLKVNGTFKEGEKTTTNFEPSKDGNIISKAYTHTKISRVEGHLSLIEKKYIECKLRADK